MSEIPRKYYVGKCRSMDSGTNEKFTVFSVPADNDKCDRWI